jgi:predicted ATPase
VALWRSDRFLAGAKLPSTPVFDDWLTRTVQYTEHLRGRTLERLSEHCTAVGNLEDALTFTRLALVYDELSVSLHERVLRLLIRLDRRSEAIRHTQAVQKIMQRELGGAAAPPLEALAQVLYEYLAPPSPAASLGWNVKASLQVPFVGREKALDQLQAAYTRGGACTVYGESGLGKTRLVQEFYWNLRPRPRLLQTACRPMESNLPFQPLTELLRHAIQPDEWAAFPSYWANALLPIFQDLAILRPELEHPGVITPGQARGMVMEALRHLLDEIAQGQRLLFFLDDAQWADEATLATLAYLMNRPPFDRRALMVITARQEEINPHLRKFIQAGGQSERQHSLLLERLNRQEILELAQHILSYSPPPSLIEQLDTDTGGNPFFILEILRNLQHKHTSQLLPAVEDWPNLPLPESVRSLVQNRLQLIHPQALKMLEIAAVIGTDFNPSTVRLAGQISSEDLSQALEELEWHHLIEPVTRPSEEICYRFLHEKIREVILLDLNPIRARYYHGQVAGALDSLMVERAFEQSGVLAQHYEAAGEWVKAFEYWIQAGLRARQLFSISEASSAFSRGDALIAQAGAHLSDEALYRLYDPWLEMAYEVDEIDTIETLGQALLRLGEQRGSALLTGTALERLGDACLAANQPEQGMAYINQALPYLEKASAHYLAAGQRPSEVPGGNAPAQQAQDSPGERKHPS